MEFLVTRLPAEFDQRHDSSCAVVKHETRFVFATPRCKTTRMAENHSGDEYDDATEDLPWRGGTFSGLEVVSRAMPARKTERSPRGFTQGESCTSARFMCSTYPVAEKVV